MVYDDKRWSKRDLSPKRYVYIWADGIYLQARLEDDAQCILVIIGATSEGKKELIGFTDGTRESDHDWRALLLDLERQVYRSRPRSLSPMARCAFGRRSAKRRQDARATLLGASADDVLNSCQAAKRSVQRLARSCRRPRIAGKV